MGDGYSLKSNVESLIALLSLLVGLGGCGALLEQGGALTASAWDAEVKAIHCLKVSVPFAPLGPVRVTGGRC